VGNWPEIVEVIECLRGEHNDTPLMTIVRALAGEMIALGDRAGSAEEGRERAQEALDSGAALERFRQFVEAQGGDPSVIEKPSTRAERDAVGTVRAPEDAEGYVADLDALAIGHAAVDLGAGRRTKEDDVDPVAGLSALKKPGDPIASGDVLARLHTRTSSAIDDVRDAVRDAYTFADSQPELAPPVQARYDASGWSDAE
jgi:pyrimidine-nucleoside phosphorylase